MFIRVDGKLPLYYKFKLNMPFLFPHQADSVTTAAAVVITEGGDMTRGVE